MKRLWLLLTLGVSASAFADVEPIRLPPTRPEAVHRVAVKAVPAAATKPSAKKAKSGSKKHARHLHRALARRHHRAR